MANPPANVLPKTCPAENANASMTIKKCAHADARTLPRPQPKQSKAPRKSNDMDLDFDLDVWFSFRGNNWACCTSFVTAFARPHRSSRTRIKVRIKTKIHSNKETPRAWERIAQNQRQQQIMRDFDGGCRAKVPEPQDGYGFCARDYKLLGEPRWYYGRGSPQQIKSLGLKAGDTIRGTIRPPKEGENILPCRRLNITSTAKPRKKIMTVLRLNT